MSAPSPATKGMTPRRRALLAVVLVLLMGVVLAVVLRSLTLPARPTISSTTGPVDPRRAYDGPYRNIHPDVRYVGDAACADCHKEIAQSYAHHPMGRSFASIESFLDRSDAFPPGAWERSGPTNNPFGALGRRFEAERQDKRLQHRQAVREDSGKPAIELVQEVHWVIGSGAKAYAFLTERDGYLFQTAISWFSQKQRWDLSPGFGPAVLAGRLVPAACLFCHVNQIPQHPEHPDRFASPLSAQSIGCERCHGPGELHVQSGDRWDIVNPAHLPPPFREAVCEQCHLEGEARILRAGRKLFDYRPGLPLHDFWAVLVQGRQSGEDAKAVNHVEQMYQSKCFSHPVGDLQMGCATCHDPHVHIGPEQRQTFYRAKCLLCHDGTKQPPVCSEPLPRRAPPPNVGGKEGDDSCIDCHMPRYRNSDITHTASTDHRIVRRDGTGAASAAHPDLENAVFVDFYRDRFPEGDPQAERTLGLGLVKLMRTNVLQPQRHADRSLRFLEWALGRDPSDIPVRQGKVDAYLLLHRPAEALSEGEVLVGEQPENWHFLLQTAFAAQGYGELDRSLDYWRRVVQINPSVADYHLQLMELLIRAGKVDEARKQGEQVLRLDPFNASARQLLSEPRP
jgi:hypothetical protein